MLPSYQATSCLTNHSELCKSHNPQYQSCCSISDVDYARSTFWCLQVCL